MLTEWSELSDLDMHGRLFGLDYLLVFVLAPLVSKIVSLVWSSLLCVVLSFPTVTFDGNLLSEIGNVCRIFEHIFFISPLAEWSVYWNTLVRPSVRSSVRPSLNFVYVTSHLSFVGFYSYSVSWLVMIWACTYDTDFTDGWFLRELYPFSGLFDHTSIRTSCVRN